MPQFETQELIQYLKWYYVLYDPHDESHWSVCCVQTPDVLVNMHS